MLEKCLNHIKDFTLFKNFLAPSQGNKNENYYRVTSVVLVCFSTITAAATYFDHSITKSIQASLGKKILPVISLVFSATAGVFYLLSSRHTAQPPKTTNNVINEDKGRRERIINKNSNISKIINNSDIITTPINNDAIRQLTPQTGTSTIPPSTVASRTFNGDITLNEEESPNNSLMTQVPQNQCGTLDNQLDGTNEQNSLSLDVTKKLNFND